MAGLRIDLGGLGLELGKDVRNERVIFFSDAVFAIAATLLVINLQPPPASDATSFEEALRTMFSHPSPFVAVAIGFFVVAMYWVSHRAIFGAVARMDGALIGANLFFLFWIALQPFFTASLAAFATVTSVVAYSACQVGAGLAQMLLWGIAGRGRMVPTITPETVRYVWFQLIRAPLIFALSIPIAIWVSPVAGMASWGLIAVSAVLIRRLGGRTVVRGGS